MRRDFSIGQAGSPAGATIEPLCEGGALVPAVMLRVRSMSAGMEDLLYEVESVRRFVGPDARRHHPQNFRHQAPVRGDQCASRGHRLAGSLTRASRPTLRCIRPKAQRGGRRVGLAHSLTTRRPATWQAAASLTAWGDAGYQGSAVSSRSRGGAAAGRGRRRRGGREAQGVGAGEGFEHPFLYVKRHFGYAKVRYRGVAKNRQRIALLMGFSNLLIAGRSGCSLPALAGRRGRRRIDADIAGIP